MQDISPKFILTLLGVIILLASFIPTMGCLMAHTPDSVDSKETPSESIVSATKCVAPTSVGGAVIFVFVEAVAILMPE